MGQNPLGEKIDVGGVDPNVGLGTEIHGKHLDIKIESEQESRGRNKEYDSLTYKLF